MANTYQLVIDAVWKGASAFAKAQADFDKLNKEATTGSQKAAASFKLMHGNIIAAGIAIGGAAIAARQLYGTLREGAQVQTTALRFDKLSASIGTTADTMLGRLREATKGMMSDMDLMSSASQIMSLRLADNEDQVIRLATVVGTLGWDMQQVILTFANMSTMRLDALGLSVSEVKDKAKELEAAGMSAQEAFKEAVILAGEARLDVGGVSEAEQAFKQFEAAIANTRSELSLMAIELATTLGLVEQLGRFAGTMNMRGMLNELKDAGQITEEQFNKLFSVLRHAGPEAAQAMLDSMLDANKQMEGGWFHMGDVVRMVNADIRNELEFTRAGIINTGMELRNLLGMAGQLDWMGGAIAGGAPSPLISDPGRDNRQRWRVLHAQAAARAADSAGPFADMRAGMSQGTTTAYGYAAAIDEVAMAHGRMASAFSAEANAKIEDGLINADGLVNMENASRALYEQAGAAGATASQLALLGVATGTLTEEQAQAALKAAILMERIKQIAGAVASGDMSIGDAMGGLSGFQQQLDSGALGGIEGLTAAADEFANGTYQATLDVENAQALAGINAVQEAVNNLDGTYYVNVMTTTNTPTEPPGRASGGPVSRNVPYFVGERGPELFVPGASGSIVPNNQLERMLTRFQGGAPISVQVTNYITGGAANADDISNQTRDKLQAALAQVRVR